MHHFQSETSPFNSEEREQVFLNKAAFDYIVSKGIWFSEGVLEHAIQGDINFPEGAVIVKASWKQIHEPESPRMFGSTSRRKIPAARSIPGCWSV